MKSVPWIEQLIRGIYERRQLPLFEIDKHNPKTFLSISQYGHTLYDGFRTAEAAERYTLEFYAARTRLIEP